MQKRWANLCLGTTLLSGLAIACACTMDGERVSVSELRTESKTVALGAAKSVRINIDMKAGELKINPGAPQLLDANFTYNVPEWQPEVRYAVQDTVGSLDISQSRMGSVSGNTRNEWDLRLGKVPTDMTVSVGAGRATLALGGLALNSLEVNMGAGETTVDLTGSWKKDLVARIQGGVGKATVRLPSDVGVHVTAHGGLGTINAGTLHKQGDVYVNGSYGKSPVTLRIEIQGGVGEINLEMGGPPPVV